MNSYFVLFLAESLILFGFAFSDLNTEPFANFKYELRPIINFEVYALAKAAKKKAKKVAKKK